MARRLGGVLKALRARTGLHPFRSTDGAVAVEFAIVAAPLLALLVATLQLGLLFLAQAALETTNELTSRLILTNQAGALTQAQFLADACANLPGMFSCSNLMVDVQQASSYSGANTSAPTLTYNSNGQVTNTWQFQVGGPGTIQVMRMMYQWPVFPGPLNLNFANLSNGSYLLMATAVFRNEP